MVTQEEQELLDRIKAVGAWSYSFQPGEGRRLMDFHNRMIKEHGMTGPVQGAWNCGSCRIKMYQALTAFLRKHEQN